jgi:hypothetical protein
MQPALRVGAAISCALGAWVSLGAVAIAPGSTTATRVGVLPPAWWLAVLLVLAVGIVVGGRWSAARCGPLYASLIALLPWLPGPIPAALLAWQGIVAAFLWVGIAVAVLAAAPIAWPAQARALVTRPRSASMVAGAGAAIVFALAWGGTADWLPAGDEPHYLVITQSLLRDGDLRIDDNHARRDYLDYYYSELKPDFLKRGLDGHVYSIHAPGVPALLAPAFAIGGYRASAWFLLVMSAAGAALLWRLAWRVSGDAAAAWFGWAVVTLSAPIATHAYTIYPDGASSVLLLIGIWVLIDAAGAPCSRLVIAGLALAALPWLHTRNAVIAAAAGVAFALRLVSRVDRWRALGAFAAIPLVSAAAWFGLFFVIYGTFNPAAPYGGYTQSSLANLLPGVPGLFFDQQYGLVATAPAFLVGLIGLLAMSVARRRPGESPPSFEARRLAVESLVIVVSYGVVVASYRMWWGGASAPARFLVPVLFPLGIPAAWLWSGARRPSDRGAMLALLTLTACSLASLTWSSEGNLAFTVRALHGPVQEWMTRAVDLSAALPSAFRTAPGQVVGMASIWIVVAAGAWMALRVLAPGRARVAWTAPWIAAVAVMVALTAGWSLSGAAPLRVDASRLAALLRVQPRSRALLLGEAGRGSARPGRRLVSAAGALPFLELRQTARGTAPSGVVAAVAPLRAGAYRVTVSPDVPREATVSVAVGRSGPLFTWAVAELARNSGGHASVDLDLPIDVNALSVTTVPPAPAGSASIEPLSVRQPLDDLAGRAATAERYGGLAAYFVTDRQFPEPGGLWVRPDGESQVVVQPNTPGPALAVFLRNGPIDNRVDIVAGGRTDSWPLRPGEERTLELPIPSGQRAVSLRFRVARWFRPSDVDPSSDDVRRLGVWVEFR